MDTIQTGTLVLTEYEANGLAEFLRDHSAMLHRIQHLSQITEAEATLAKRSEELADALVRRLEAINFGE